MKSKPSESEMVLLLRGVARKPERKKQEQFLLDVSCAVDSAFEEAGDNRADLNKAIELLVTEIERRFLESGLLRLLEASEKLREWSYSVTSYDDNVPYVNGRYDSNVEHVQTEYDAAKAAMKEPK